MKAKIIFQFISVFLFYYKKKLPQFHTKLVSQKVLLFCHFLQQHGFIYSFYLDSAKMHPILYVFPKYSSKGSCLLWSITCKRLSVCRGSVVLQRHFKVATSLKPLIVYTFGDQFFIADKNNPPKGRYFCLIY